MTTYHHTAIEGFTDLRSEIAPNIPKAMDAFKRVANRPWEFLSDIIEKFAKEDIKKSGCYSSKTIGGKESFIQAVLIAGKKRYLVVSMQSTAAWIEEPRTGKFVPIPAYDRDALVARLTA